MFAIMHSLIFFLVKPDKAMCRLITIVTGETEGKEVGVKSTTGIRNFIYEKVKLEGRRTLV